MPITRWFLRMTDDDTVGWTYEEYMKSPETVNRLHKRLLDVQDENDRLRDKVYALHNKAVEYMDEARQEILEGVDRQSVAWLLGKGIERLREVREGD
jgi:predicted transcriptional regulator